MAPDRHHWLTLHRVRFPSEISAQQRRFPAPALAECWRFCPSRPRGYDGLPTWVSDTWCGLGIYGERAEAEAMLSEPQTQLPFLSEAVEQWHALLIPFMHRGRVNWRGTVEDGTAIRGAPAPAPPDGPLAIITTAGFESSAPEELPRVERFLRGVGQVVEFYGTADGNLRRDVFTGPFDQREGFTLSLWRNDAAMERAAYGPGTHRTLMEQSRDGSMFDRSSFTRARILASHGSWDGDPLAETG